MLADIATVLYPGEPLTAVQATLHKLNIYTTGGHFKAHLDTPSSSQHFGSLVISLPCLFEGGQLVLRHAGEEISLSLNGQEMEAPSTAQAAVDGDGTGPLLHFAAFYGDVEHEVRPVTSGHRITLTYKLTSAPGAPAAGRPARLMSATPSLRLSSVAQALSNMLKDASWLPQGGQIGLFLGHKYAVCIRNGIKDSMFPGILKGSDRLLYAACCEELGLEGSIRPVFAGQAAFETLTTEEQADHRRDNLDLDGMYIGKSFEAVEFGGGCLYEEPYDDNMRWMGLMPIQEAGVEWIIGSSGGHAFPYADVMASYGNEPSIDFIYSDAAMVIKVPAYNTPARPSPEGA